MEKQINDFATLLNDLWIELEAAEDRCHQLYIIKEKVCDEFKALGIYEEVWEAANALNEQGREEKR